MNVSLVGANSASCFSSILVASFIFSVRVKRLQLRTKKATSGCRLFIFQIGLSRETHKKHERKNWRNMKITWREITEHERNMKRNIWRKNEGIWKGQETWIELNTKWKELKGKSKVRPLFSLANLPLFWASFLYLVFPSNSFRIPLELLCLSTHIHFCLVILPLKNVYLHVLGNFPLMCLSVYF